MPNPQFLPTIERINFLILKKDYFKIIFPDEQQSYMYYENVQIGTSWYSSYWDMDVEVVEMTENKKTVWVEGIKNA